MTSYIFIPPHAGLMPHPCPTSSPEKAKLTVRRLADGVRNRPVTGSLESLTFARSWNTTRYEISSPAGSPLRSTRAVKSLSASAAGPTTRTASPNESLVAHSTTRRAGRSVRLHTMARSPVTSPLWTPYGMAGRIRSGVTTAGAGP